MENRLLSFFVLVCCFGFPNEAIHAKSDAKLVALQANTIQNLGDPARNMTWNYQTGT